MKRGIVLGSMLLVLMFTACTSAKYGYDDVYDHDYPENTAVAKADEDQRTYQEPAAPGKYDTYKEEDYTYYGRNYSSSSYSSRISRFYGPSISISYYSSCYNPYYGYSSYYYYPSYPSYYSYNWYDPWNWYNYDPYYWHLHHYHYNYWNNWNPYSGYNPYYGYNHWNQGYWPSYYPGHYPSYYPGYYYGDGGYSSGGNNTYYGPRPDYNRNTGTQQQSITTPGNLQNETNTIYENGVKVRTIIKDQPENNNQQPQNNQPTLVPQPVTPTVTPRPNYNQPNNNPKPEPKPVITPGPRPTPQHNNDNKPKIKTIDKPQGNTPQVRPSSGSTGSGNSGNGGTTIKTIRKD